MTAWARWVLAESAADAAKTPDGAPRGAVHWQLSCADCASLSAWCTHIRNGCADWRAVPLLFEGREKLKSLGRIRAARTMERDRMNGMMSAQAVKDSNADLSGRDA